VFVTEARSDRIKALGRDAPFDLLVIGGGATGCGIALDAATRGLSVALVERQDFAAGASSRSTKLLHGGVRYLEAAVLKRDPTQFKLVLEALAERGRLLANAPHLSRVLSLVTPVYRWRDLPYLAAGLKLYDWLAGARSIGSSRILSRKQMAKRFPGLRQKGLKAGILYFDGQFIDSRLVMSLLHTARQAGALLVNYAAVTSLRHDFDGRLDGALVTDLETGQEITVAARAVINAAGPFADQVARLDDPAAAPLLATSSGAHLLLPRRFLPGPDGILLPETKDGRVLFILPWQDHVLVGTTDQPAAVADHPGVSEAEAAYLLDHLNEIFTMQVDRADVLALWSGLRPLAFQPGAGASAQLARDHVITTTPSGLISMVGGKWTTYRLMAEQAVDRVVAAAGLSPARACRTADLRLWGGENASADAAAALQQRFGLPADIATHLLEFYGGHAAELELKNHPERLHPDHPFIAAEVRHAVEAEDAVHAIDILARRLTLAFIDQTATALAAPKVIGLMAGLLGWDSARCAAEAKLVEARLASGI
jgi:glycerol-3-phosphate dehydrogenase